MRQIILHIVHVKVRMKMELNKKVYAKPIFSGVPSKKNKYILDNETFPNIKCRRKWKWKKIEINESFKRIGLNWSL